MNEELKALLGDAYKENMTLEEVGEFFKGKKFADLSSGQYVDKNKFDNAVNDLHKKLTDANNQLSAKLTDEEKAQQAKQAQEAEIKQLRQLLTENTINGNKNVVVGVLTSTRDTLGLQATDQDFTKFVDNITSEDGAKSTEVANYVAKVVKDAYEKGKKDATKDAMGNLGQGQAQSSNGAGGSDIGNLGAELAKSLAGNNQKSYDYFNKK